MAAFVGRYATAFLDVVTAAGLDTAAIEGQWRDFLATWEASSELREFFANPAIPSVQKVAVLDKMNAKLAMQKELRNLLAVLIDHGRIAQVAEVAEAYRALQQQRMGIHPIEVISARPLDASERTALENEAARLAGGRIEASYREDASMIGGAVVRIGSTVYDGSLRGRLERLKEALVSGQ